MRYHVFKVWFNYYLNHSREILKCWNIEELIVDEVKLFVQDSHLTWKVAVWKNKNTTWYYFQSCPRLLNNAEECAWMVNIIQDWKWDVRIESGFDDARADPPSEDVDECIVKYFQWLPNVVVVIVGTQPSPLSSLPLIIFIVVVINS